MAWLEGKVRFFEKITAPTVNDDENDGYRLSDVWINTVTDKAYRCLDASVGAAVWSEGGGAGIDFAITATLGTL